MNRIRVALTFLCILFPLVGCQTNGWVSTPISFDHAIIAVQPISQIVPPGQTATFTVTATSDLPLTYQWELNGTAIPGATGTSYTTPPALGANGSMLVGTFQVIVHNSSTITPSEQATLTIGPRPPKLGDLRYLLMQQVAPDALSQNIGGCYALSGGCIDYDALGTPLALGANGDGDSWAWFLVAPSGYKMEYQPGSYSYLASDMQSLSPPDAVVTSLSLVPANRAFTYGVSWVQNIEGGGFDYRFDPVAPPGTGQQPQIQAQAALDGIQSRIITAAFFDPSGNANLLSYGWQGDTTTVYEAQTVLVPPGSGAITGVTVAATTLGGEGYFISAFGGDDTNGYVLVGMRVQGDSFPRPIKIETWLGGTYSTTAATNATWANFTAVAWLDEPGNEVVIWEQ